jgi:2,3-bisphosphoglycerate-independent phosphoglycerate mutase
MGDTPAFMIKGDAHAFVIGDGMGDTPTFMIKGDTHAFVIGDGMGDTPTFMIKGDAPLATHISLLTDIIY